MGTKEPQDLESALEAFKKCSNVDMCISLAHKMKFSQDKF